MIDRHAPRPYPPTASAPAPPPMSARNEDPEYQASAPRTAPAPRRRVLSVWVIVALFAAGIVLPLRALRLASRRVPASAVAPPSPPADAGAPRSIRVGLLIYRVGQAAVRRAPTADATALDAEPRVQVRVPLTRSNATQTWAPVRASGLRLRTASGSAYAPLEMHATRCSVGEDCSVLDPGQSRDDVVVFVVPAREIAVGGVLLEVRAAEGEAGPRNAEIALAMTAAPER